MAYLLSMLASATFLFAFSPAGMFAIYGPVLLLIDLLTLILKVVKVVRRGFARGRPVDWLDSKMRLAIEGLGPELGDEWRAALVWLHRARVLWGCPVHAAVCLLGLSLLGTGLLPLLHGVPRDAALARAIACEGAFTAFSVAYVVAIEACRWRMHVHVKRALAA